MNNRPDSQQNAPCKFVQGFFAQILIKWKWMPLGMISVILLISFSFQQEWLMAIIIFPVMMATAIWAVYTESFLEQLQKKYKLQKEDKERAKKNTKSQNLRYPKPEDKGFKFRRHWGRR